MEIFLIALVPAIIVALSGLYFKHRSNIMVFAVHIGILVVVLGDLKYGFLDVLAVWGGYRVALTLYSNRSED